MGRSSGGAKATFVAGCVVLALSWVARIAAENADGWNAFPYIALSRIVLLPLGLLLVAVGGLWWFLSWPGPQRRGMP